MIRGMLVLATALVLTSTFGPAIVLLNLFGARPRNRHSFAQWAFRTFAGALCRAAGARITVHGQENVPPGQGVIYAMNHVSWFDVLAMAATLRWYTFVAKSELRRIPIFGYCAEAGGLIFLERENRKAAFESYKVAAAEVQRGRSAVVCPEGTRGLDYHLRPFKKGPFVLAIAAQAPIVPTIVYGAREVMPKGTFRVRPGAIEIHFLPPIETRGLAYDDRTELMSRVWVRMSEAMRELFSVTTNEYPIASEHVERSA